MNPCKLAQSLECNNYAKQKNKKKHTNNLTSYWINLFLTSISNIVMNLFVFVLLSGEYLHQENDLRLFGGPFCEDY